MDFDLEIKNYRCFVDEKPARLRFRKGFTAFVGPNNAGKSTLLKSLYDFRSVFSYLAYPSHFSSAVGDRRALRYRHQLLPENEDRVFSWLNDPSIELTVRLRDVPSSEDDVPSVDEVVVGLPRDAQGLPRVVAKVAGRPIDEEATRYRYDSTLRDSEANPTADAAHVCAALQDLSECMFVGSFRNALNVQPQGSYYDIQVGATFIGSWAHLKTSPNRKANASAYRVAEDIKRIFGLSGIDINPSADGTTLVVYKNGEAHTLEELGSGLAQFVLTLANAAMKEPTYILVDEPELSLHPSLQLDFLTTLGSYAREGVFFATHSVGLARASAEAIYSVRQREDGVSEISDFETEAQLPELLGELSYSGYRDLGHRAVLLVEGATDVKIMQQFLRKRRKDHEVVYIPLGGASMISGEREHELAEMTRIAKRAVAVIDSERESKTAFIPTEREAFRSLCERLGITCHVLERRALENYLGERAVKRVKGESYRELTHYERLADVDPAWAKAESWRIAREMEIHELEGTDLHEILTSL